MNLAAGVCVCIYDFASSYSAPRAEIRGETLSHAVCVQTLSTVGAEIRQTQDMKLKKALEETAALTSEQTQSKAWLSDCESYLPALGLI